MQEWVGLWLRRQKGTGRRKHRRATIQGMEHARVQGQSRSRSRCIWLSARLACTWNADKAWQLMNQLAEEGARLGCHHCQRVMANCNWWSHGCKHDAARSLESALESSVNGSRFGLCTHGVLHESDVRGRAQDYAQAVAFYHLAALQGLDKAQRALGQTRTFHTLDIDRNEGRRWLQLAVAQDDRLESDSDRDSDWDDPYEGDGPWPLFWCGAPPPPGWIAPP